MVSNCCVLKKLRILAQSMELECMNLHIMRVGLKNVQTSKEGLYSFLSDVFAKDFALTNNLTSSRTLYVPNIFQFVKDLLDHV